jgi:hypothetical protein
MRIPVILSDTVYHLGTLDPEARGRRFKSSYEGAGLSVSRCPAAWEEIAKLGGSPTYILERAGATWVDLMAIAADDRAAIIRWAEEANLVEAGETWRAWTTNEDGAWMSISCKSEEDAWAEYGFSPMDSDFDERCEEFIDEMGEPPEGKLVHCLPITVLTEEGNVRAAGFGTHDEAWDIAAMFWCEDVLRREHPEVMGVWWMYDLDVGSLSAPAGAIFPVCLQEFSRQQDFALVEDIDEACAEEPLDNAVFEVDPLLVALHP